MARVVELPGCVAHGSSESEALGRLAELQALWIADALETGDAIPAPLPDEDRLPSGRWVQRVPRTLHQRLVALAKVERVSLNQLVTSLLAEGVGVKKKESTDWNPLLPHFAKWVQHFATGHVAMPSNSTTALMRWPSTPGRAGATSSKRSRAFDTRALGMADLTDEAATYIETGGANG